MTKQPRTKVEHEPNAGSGVGALEGPVRPEQPGCQDLIDPPGEQVLLGDRHERLGALAKDAGLLGHSLGTA